MDILLKNRLFGFGVFALVVLNIIMLTVFFHGPPPGPRPGHHPDGGPGGRPGGPGGLDYIEQRLGLSSQQLIKFQAIRDDHFIRSRKLRQQIHKCKNDIIDIVFAKVNNEAKANELSQEIGRLSIELEKEYTRHFIELKNVCDPEQQIKLQIMFHEMIEEKQRKGPPGGPPRNRHTGKRPH